MWIQAVLFAGVVQLLLLLIHKPSTKKVKAGRSNSITRIGLGSILKELLLGLTLNSGLANYEWTYNICKKSGTSVVAISKSLFTEAKAVMCTDLDICKKVMTSPAWLDRFAEDHYLHRTAFEKPYGLIFGGGEYYKKSIRITLKILHQFDFFKPSKIEGVAAHEIAELDSQLFGDRIDGNGGQLIFSPHQMFGVSTLNVVWQILMGSRFAHDDTVVKNILERSDRCNREFSAGYTIMEVLPFLKYFPRLTFLGSFMDCSNVLYDVFREIFKQKRRERSSFESEPNDFVDAFLQEIDRTDGKDVTDKHLMAVMRDMVLAGLDTTNSTLEHGLLHISLQPKIQRQIQAEIDQVIGMARAPSLTDRDKMPFTRAVLLETLRLGSPLPATSRSASDDSALGDCKMPKGTLFSVNIYGIHRDEALWTDPFSFRPERFLSKEGKVINTDKIIPFGFGKRSCTGEPVAQGTLFIFFVTLLQRYEFEISDSQPPPNVEKNLMGLSRGPVPYYLKVRHRPS